MCVESIQFSEIQMHVKVTCVHAWTCGKRVVGNLCGCFRVLPRKNPQSGTRFDKVCHIAELEGIMLEGIYGNYYYRGNKFILC